MQDWISCRVNLETMYIIHITGKKFIERGRFRRIFPLLLTESYYFINITVSYILSFSCRP